MSMTRRGVFSAIAAIAAAFGAQRSAHAQHLRWRVGNQNELVTGEPDPVVIGPDTHPELYWRVIYRCPKGHEEVTDAMKEHFDPAESLTASWYCLRCHNEWLAQRFPPPAYAEFREIPAGGRR